jgi:hypothetical protein
MGLKNGLIGLLFLALVTGACSSNSAEENATATPAPNAPAPNAMASETAKSAPASRPAAPAPNKPAPVVPKMVNVPAGTELTVILIDSISSGTNKAGDTFMASLGAPIMVGGKTVVDKGTKVQGLVVDAQGAGRVKGRANIRLVLTGIIDGAKTIPIVTQPFYAEAEATKGRDAAVVGGGSGLGAAIGAIAGGKKGAGIGAIVGGAAGTGTVLATKGKEVEYGSESKLTFTLDKAVDLPVSSKM